MTLDSINATIVLLILFMLVLQHIAAHKEITAILRRKVKAVISTEL